MDWTIVEWAAWDGFLIRSILPGARRVRAMPGAPLGSLPVGGDPTLLHLNLSRPPLAFPDYDDWVGMRDREGNAPLNGRLRSIDKWSVQDACLSAGLPATRASPEGEPDEMLLLKTRANHLGEHDRLLPPELTGGSLPLWTHPERAFVLRRAELPPGCWTDPGLVVERFVSNRIGLFHRAYVAGSYVAVATSRAEGVVKEMDHRRGILFRSTEDGNALARADDDPLSVAFRLARAMCADFAAIDLVVDDAGAVYPVDVNSTPWWGDDENDRLIRELRAAFAGMRSAPSA